LLEFFIAPAGEGTVSRVPRPLRAICGKATEPERSKRYTTVPELARDISRFLDKAPVSAHRENLWDRTQRFYNRYQAAILLIAMYLLMRTLFVIYGRH